MSKPKVGVESSTDVTTRPGRQEQQAERGVQEGRLQAADPVRNDELHHAFETREWYTHMGGCENYGPLLGPLNTRYYAQDPKRHYNFDNQTCWIW